MSGYKYSPIALEREREEKLRLLGDIGDARARLSGLATKIRETLGRTPEGIRATFNKEVESGLGWLREVDQQKMGELGMEIPVDRLRTTLSVLNGALRNGQAILDSLIVSFTQKADAMETALIAKLSTLESNYYGCQQSLKIWFGPDVIGDCEKSLRNAKQLHESRQLRELERCLEGIEWMLTSKAREAQELAHKHQKRLYVLKALRQVCKEMGFEESEPRYEGGSRRGHITYEVDTLDQGKIRFFLSLDGISTHSGITEDRCLDEFDKVSHFLEEEFGIKTKFRYEGEKPDEKLLHKGEMGLPEGAYLERTA